MGKGGHAWGVLEAGHGGEGLDGSGVGGELWRQNRAWGRAGEERGAGMGGGGGSGWSVGVGVAGPPPYPVEALLAG